MKVSFLLKTFLGKTTLLKPQKLIEPLLYHHIVADLTKFYEEVRFVAHNLRPLGFLEIGLKKAIENLFDILNSSSDSLFSSKVDKSLNQVPKGLQYHIYQFVLELCTNAQKHSNGKEVQLSIEIKAERIFLDFADNGDSYDAANTPGIGLRNMLRKVESHHGKMAIITEKGFNVKIEIPLED